MKIESIDIEATIKKAQTLVREDKQCLRPRSRCLKFLILIISLLANRLDLNSTNSSKPPASDPNRKKKPKSKTGKKAGGQKGHVGTTLKKVDNPDKVEVIKVDRSKLPSGRYRQAGFETRQVFDIEISRVVTEYRAQVLKDDNGNRFVAPFPNNVTKAVQYGQASKPIRSTCHNFQLVPYNRIQDYFSDQLHIPISEGSIFNFQQRSLPVFGRL